MDTIAQEAKVNGWVIVNHYGEIMDWSFGFNRSYVIKQLESDTKQDWRAWYRQGTRCVKATKTISIR